MYEYKVVWTGHDEETATWEPEANLSNAMDKVDLFLRGMLFAWEYKARFPKFALRQNFKTF